MYTCFYLKTGISTFVYVCICLCRCICTCTICMCTCTLRCTCRKEWQLLPRGLAGVAAAESPKGGLSVGQG